jgi:MFS family permease
MTAQLVRPTATAATTGHKPLSPLGMAVLLLGAFLPMLDFFIVNVALPTIDSTLHASAPALEFVVAGYGTAYAVSLVVGGRLGDALGRVLITARVLQGIFAALIQPQVLATFQATLDGQPRSRAIGRYAATGGVAVVVGQLLGGLLLDANIAGWTWRPIFLVNVPFGIAALLLVRRVVPATRSEHPAGVDVPGTALLALTVVTLLVPLTEGPSLHWPAWLWAMLAVSPIAAGAMAVVERRAERAGVTPLVPPSVIGLPSVRRGLLMAVPFFLGFGAFTFVFALTVQDGLHKDALRSGLAITPMAVAFFTGSLLMARLFERFGPRLLAVGFAVQATGLLWQVMVVAAQWPNVSLLMLAPGLAAAGFGQSLGRGSLFRTVLAGVPQRLAGVGSGVLVTVQQGSLALGVASLGTLFVTLAAHDYRTAFVTVVGIQTAFGVLLALASARRPAVAHHTVAVSVEPLPASAH